MGLRRRGTSLWRNSLVSGKLRVQCTCHLPYALRTRIDEAKIITRCVFFAFALVRDVRIILTDGVLITPVGVQILAMWS